MRKDKTILSSCFHHCSNRRGQTTFIIAEKFQQKSRRVVVFRRLFSAKRSDQLQRNHNNPECNLRDNIWSSWSLAHVILPICHFWYTSTFTVSLDTQKESAIIWSTFAHKILRDAPFSVDWSWQSCSVLDSWRLILSHLHFWKVEQVRPCLTFLQLPWWFFKHKKDPP